MTLEFVLNFDYRWRRSIRELRNIFDWILANRVGVDIFVQPNLKLLIMSPAQVIFGCNLIDFLPSPPGQVQALAGVDHSEGGPGSLPRGPWPTWRSLTRTAVCGWHIQGLQYILTQSNSLLLLNFESERLPEPTGGSPDVVHLIINASQASEWLLKAQKGLEKKES